MFLGLDFNSVPWGWLLGAGISIVTAIGLAIAFFVSREYIKQTMKVLKDTIASQEGSLRAKDELALALAATHKQHEASIEAKLAAMTLERDNYRDRLHDTREPMQAMTLKIQEYELRPDLNLILKKEEAWHQRREEFYTEMARNQTTIMGIQRETIQLIGEIKGNVEIELKQSNEVCAQVGKALQEVIEKMDAREDAAAERDTGIIELLTEIRDLRKNQPAT